MIVSEQTRLYLALGATDMRKQIDGLAALVEEVLEQDPFCNRARDKLKILYWQRNGVWLWYRRLERERERFRWPRAEQLGGGALEISAREPRWLLDGLDIGRLQGHRMVEFKLL